MSELLLQTRNLTKQYGRHRAVDDVNMHIKKGAIYGFIGRNGAGKTTCLKMISGLSTPSYGEIEMFGYKGKDLQKVRSRVGCLIEAPGLYGNMSAYDNLNIKCKLTGIKKKGYIEALLKTVGLDTVGEKKTKHYSLGMKQRLGIALALVGEPDLLILDEPINGLDPQGIVEVRETIQKLAKERGMTICISSHILEELSKIATDYGIIHNGCLVQELTREELMKKCSERIELTLDNPKQAVPVLDDMGFSSYQVIDKEHIHIFERLGESASLNMELAKAGIPVKGISALLTSFLSKIDYDAVNKEWERQQAVESQADTDGQAADVVNAQDIEQQQAADSNKEQLSQQNTDNVNIGMSVELPTEPGKKVTVMDVFFSNAQGKFYALFLVIFAVMFATADIKSGYIKNIGGQVSQRGMLIVSRAVALALFTAITFAGIFVFQAAANMLAFKCVMWGNWKEIIPYFLTELMLHYAFVLICMAIAVIIKNNVISMTLSVCLTMNIMSIVYALIDYVGNRVGLHNFNIYKYTVTGRMAMLPMNAGREDVVSSMCVAAIFIIIMLSLSSYIFQKRDI